MDMWEDAFGGWVRITDYRGEAAAVYLTKYVTKGGLVDVFASSRDRDRIKPN
jgi:hypothetical protein